MHVLFCSVVLETTLKLIEIGEEEEDRARKKVKKVEAFFRGKKVYKRFKVIYFCGRSYLTIIRRT